MTMMVATVRGMEPIDRLCFAPAFLAHHEASRLLGDGLVHAFSPTRMPDDGLVHAFLPTRMPDDGLVHAFLPTHKDVERDVTEHHEGGALYWARYCASSMLHNYLPGAPCPLPNITCVVCTAALFR